MSRDTTWWREGELLNDADLMFFDAAEFLCEEEQETHEFRLCQMPLHALPDIPPGSLARFTSLPDDRQRIASIEDGMTRLGILSFLEHRPLVWTLADGLVDGWHRLYVIRGRGDLDSVPTVVACPHEPAYT